MSNKIILSTGILSREPLTVTAVIQVVNTDRKHFHRVTVEVWDWSSYSDPTLLPVLIGDNQDANFPYRLAARHAAVFYTHLNEQVQLYEIRIIHSDHNDIIANCFGRSAPPYTSQEGNTVLYRQLVVVDR